MKTYLAVLIILLSFSTSFSQETKCECYSKSGVTEKTGIGGWTSIIGTNSEGEQLQYHFYAAYFPPQELCIPRDNFWWQEVDAAILKAIKSHPIYKSSQIALKTDDPDATPTANSIAGGAFITQKKVYEIERLPGTIVSVDAYIQERFASKLSLCSDIDDEKPTTTPIENNEQSDSYTRINKDVISSKGNQPNDAQNFINNQNAATERYDAALKNLGNTLNTKFTQISNAWAKEAEFQSKISSLTNIKSIDASSIVSEARSKAEQINIEYNRKKDDALNQGVSATQTLINSAQNEKQAIAGGVIGLGLTALSQASIEKERKDAQEKLENEKQQILGEISQKIINKYKPVVSASFDKIPYTVLKNEEEYYNELYKFSKCMCENAYKIITEDFECKKISTKLNEKSDYSGEDYYNAFKRKSKSINKRISEKAGYFLELAIESENSKPIWLLDKAHFGDYNTYKKLILINKAYQLGSNNSVIKKEYFKYQNRYDSLHNQAKLIVKGIKEIPNLHNFKKHNNVYVVKVLDTYFICNENIIPVEEKFHQVNQFDNDVAIFTKENPFDNNTYMGLLDLNGEKITKNKYNLIEPFSNKLALASIDKVGFQFINNKGINVFNKTYNGAFSFKDGVARVSSSQNNPYSLNNSVSSNVKSNSDFYFINTQGERIIMSDFDVIGDFSEGLALARDQKGNLLFLNSNGNVEFKVDSKLEVMHVRELSDFKNGFSLLRKGRNQFHYVNRDGKSAIKTSYLNPQPFNENRALVSNFENDKLTFSFIDTKGKLISDFEYDYAMNFSEGRACISKNEKYGFIDINGDLIIPLNYDSPSLFQNGVARVMKNGKIYKIDKDNNIIE